MNQTDRTVAKAIFLSSKIPRQTFSDELAALIKRWRCYSSIDEGKVWVAYPVVFIKAG